MAWVKCSEQQPPEWVWVLIALDDGSVEIDRWDGRDWEIYHAPFITHWQLKPEPPKPGE